MTPAVPAPPERTARRRLRQAGRWAVLVAAVALAWPRPTGDAATAVLLPALSPLVALGSILATRTAGVLVLLALPVLALASLFPRWFCRHGCPAGLLQESLERFHPAAPARPARGPEVGTWLVALTLGGAVLGYPLFLWLDPLALFNGFVSAWRGPVVAANLLAGLGLPLLLLFSLVRPRLWCRRLCPLGATQELLAWPRAWLRGRRGRPAPSPPAVSKVSTPSESSAPGTRYGPPLARRLFVGGCVGAAGAWFVQATGGRTAPPLRPPGSLPEDRFRGVCIRCGNCAAACPSKIIQPDFGLSGVGGLLTPRLGFEADYCREDCCRCGRVCPSGAIARLSLPEKRRRVIGPAQLNPDTCLLANGRECTACLRACPFGALAMHSADGGFSSEPRVDATRCTGCGACEAICPVRPHRAIRVAARPGLLPA